MKHYLYIGALAVTMTFACNSSEPKEETKAPNNESEVSLTAEQAKNIDLKTGEVGFGEINETLKLQGKIDVPPQNLVSVSIPLGGYLKSTKMLPGTQVSKGQIIAVMEDPQYIQLQQDYLNIHNRLNFATKELARQQELNASKANSDKTLQQVEMEYKSLKIEQMALAEKLKLININANQLSEGKISKSVNVYSPINGYVSKVNVNIGKYVTPSDVIFELVNPTDIHLNLNVFEKDLHKLGVGQRVMAYTNVKPDKKYETEVILVSHNVDGGRSEVHCHFEQYDKSLVPGMYMNAELQFKNRKVQFLPEEAVVSFENKDYVFVEIAPRKFNMTEVQAGEVSEGKTEIATDLKGKKVVVKGAYSLLMKLKNTVEEE
ncbi:efflux RND transporter periplasmic adaptor subunit [Pedobacter sp. SL55]|uniref:efflux RND transporter periplasmic adaptor subunit n=1 Tax=Pedobacter sp. SL55 TaxID=2995161 RepID=UPI002270957A|nr:efflux RND transporter periplasmic adaptor subunit [Pedobacter sp. SL55]WAC39663.1 efflux RND transporter periplasmic adaptor subunit [Pedobacter sp. SL55]